MNLSKSLRIRPDRCALLVTGALLCAACEDAPTEPASSDDAVALTDAVMTGMAGMQLAAVPGQTLHVDRRVNCPAGGTLTQLGTSSMTAEGDERAITWDFTMRHDSCALAIRGESITTDGTVQTTGVQRVRLPAAQGQPPILLELETRQHGTMTTTFRDRSRTCDVDVVQRFDPGTQTIRLTGTSCGHSIDLTRPLHP